MGTVQRFPREKNVEAPPRSAKPRARALSILVASFTLIVLLVCTHVPAAGARYAASALSWRMQMRETSRRVRIYPVLMRPRRPDLACHGDRECASRTLGCGCFASQRSYHEPARWSVIAPAFSTSNGEKCPLLLLVSTGRLAHNEKPRIAPADVSRPTVILVPLDLCGTSYRPSAICIQRASDAR